MKITQTMGNWSVEHDLQKTREKIDNMFGEGTAKLLTVPFESEVDALHKALELKKVFVIVVETSDGDTLRQAIPGNDAREVLQEMLELYSLRKVSKIEIEIMEVKS